MAPGALASVAACEGGEGTCRRRGRAARAPRPPPEQPRPGRPPQAAGLRQSQNQDARYNRKIKLHSVFEVSKDENRLPSYANHYVAIFSNLVLQL